MTRRIASGAVLAAGTVAMVGLTGLPAAAESTSATVPAHCDLGDASATGFDGTVDLTMDAPGSVPAGRTDVPLTLHPALSPTDPTVAALLALGDPVAISDLVVDATATRTDPSGATSTTPVRFVGANPEVSLDPTTGAITSVGGDLTPDDHGWIGSSPTGSITITPTALSATLNTGDSASTLRCELDQASLAPIRFLADADTDAAGSEPAAEDEASAAPSTAGSPAAAAPSGVRELANTGAGPVVPIFVTGLSMLVAGVGLLVGLRWLAPRHQPDPVETV